MRLNPEIIFDEFEEVHNANEKIFISSMLNIESLIVPKYFPAKIYTSRDIAKQMLTYYKHKDIMQLKLSDFIYMEPNVALSLALNKAECLEVVMLDTTDIAKKVMFMLRQGSKTQIYAGICTEIRSIVFNGIFVDWIRNGVCELYVDVSRATSQVDFLPIGIKTNKAIDAIENLLQAKPDNTFVLNIPKFGYESFIYQLADRLRCRVHISGLISAIFKFLNKSEHFVIQRENAKIVIVSKCLTIDDMKRAYENRKWIFIKVTDKADTDRNYATKLSEFFYELNWSPMPSTFELHLLASIVQPNCIKAIHHNSYATQMNPQVPDYLLQLCKDYAKIVNEMKENKDIEMQEFEQLISPESTVDNTSRTSLFSMAMTQQDKLDCTISTNRVKEWLNSNQADNSISCNLPGNAQKSSTSITQTNEPKTKKKTNSSSVTKSLAQMQQQTTKTTSPNAAVLTHSFCIKKGQLLYLEDSDSS